MAAWLGLSIQVPQLHEEEAASAQEDPCGS